MAYPKVMHHSIETEIDKDKNRAKFIKMLMAENGESVERLAKALGAETHYVRCRLNGVTKIDINFINRVADYYGLGKNARFALINGKYISIRELFEERYGE